MVECLRVSEEPYGHRCACCRSELGGRTHLETSIVNGGTMLAVRTMTERWERTEGRSMRVIDGTSLKGISNVVDEGQSCMLIDDVGERRRDEFCQTSQCHGLGERARGSSLRRNVAA